ncbi:MAG: transketolase [Candidatus Sungbacteria bacterium RIFCSPLOWO2_02_FULL_47_9]|uniref:Transketolase n=1 Tax=Candidatus Sungbacteria bacterium RIFCSPHIGHO2_01_FULL_47_32 TaxID=1802264 RepID=A0A1G2K3M9_9BACT|nr:MAG: Transketolase domain protein [Parcubacteria group bacterium GW2011_GWA2_47_10]OGZ93783.1 MAG: transketolase [Candidatus Sungbacteria bacterium RIFCSPHIGHO2_01_FULL_47_32]OHA05681.1 MAG: transketolase [Candidatus Sungbacteria bacterium RIFCSPLOWO2_01_FULL_47_32]OHA10521.1 MAG: transketolase [Candidatus Sungbacteria bacterium RIFCSPLOWO2_02_FULL_47_9]
MSYLNDEKIKFLEEKANAVRMSIIEMLLAAGSGHTAGPLGMADIFTALYFHILKHDPKNPEWPERDFLVLSNGHICPVQYAAMAHAGYFPIEELLTLRKFGTRLQGHPHREKLPGIEVSSGPLGSGLGQAVGIAIGLKMDKKPNQVVCIMGDGEQDCGIVWESLMLAGKHHLDNLTVVIDRNNIQIDGMTEDIMPLEPMRAKYEAFNWHVIDLNAHNFQDINSAFEEARGIYEKPVILLAHTIPGKGIPEIEFDYRWHGNPPGKGPGDIIPQPEQGKKFLDELRTLGGKIKGEHQ